MMPFVNLMSSLFWLVNLGTGDDQARMKRIGSDYMGQAAI
jgi:hypothetical protein